MVCWIQHASDKYLPYGSCRWPSQGAKDILAYEHKWQRINTSSVAMHPSPEARLMKHFHSEVWVAFAEWNFGTEIRFPPYREDWAPSMDEPEALSSPWRGGGKGGKKKGKEEKGRGRRKGKEGNLNRERERKGGWSKGIGEWVEIVDQ